jgi:serine/threonine kinase PknH
MPALDFLSGKIGPYRLLEKIGEGGMGMVYLARDAEGRRVAVKVLGPAVTADPNARRRLFREVETMRRVRSRYVAEILDADVTGPSPYIVTRYVPGQTLDDWVRDNGPLRGPQLERLATGLAAALAAIHAAGVIHRDLKPGNVMLMDGQPVVIDFGIAHIPDATRLTQTGMVMGTPGYLAPEVIEGQPSTGAADVHSWGATVAFAATGRQPYGAGTYQTIFYRVLQGKAELDGIPAPLLPLVAAALSVNPRARPSAQVLTEHCARLRLDGFGPPPAAGPSGTRLASAAVPWRDDLDGSPVRPAWFGSPGAASAAQAAVRSAPAAPVAQPPYRGPAEAAADVADLLPPVDYARSARSAGGYPRAAPSGARIAGHGLVLLAFGVAAVALSVLLPVAGTALSLAVITLLRAADRAQAGLAERRSVRGARPSDIFIVVVSAPWTVVRALLATVAIAPVALLAAGAAAGASVILGHTQTLPAAGSWAAGAAVAMYAVGPGSSRPRRQLRRISATVIRSRASMVVAIIATWALAAATVSSALSQPPLIWPATSWMLPHVLPSMGGTLHTIQKWLLRNTVGVLHVP